MLIRKIATQGIATFICTVLNDYVQCYSSRCNEKIGITIEIVASLKEPRKPSSEGRIGTASTRVHVDSIIVIEPF